MRTLWISGSVLVVGLCACGSPGPDGDGAPSGLADAEERIIECLDNANQDTSTENVHIRVEDDPEYGAALAQCAESAGVTLPDPQDVVQSIDTYVLGQIECLEEAGWDLAAPIRGQHGGLTLDGIDRDIPEDQFHDFEADVDACAQVEAPSPEHGE